ncbi:MAG: hypothetical protein MUO33_03500, partial [Sedimentisphaerales bacterium]|nr:hypothetical protein [Sedimentisphaerales bacterium]
PCFCRGKLAPAQAGVRRINMKGLGRSEERRVRFAPAPQLQVLSIGLRLLSRFVLCAGSLSQL